MTDTNYFKTFCKISKAFGTTLKKGELLEIILQSAIDTMGGKAACIFLSPEDSQEDVFVPIAQKGLSENYLHAAPMQARKVVGDILKGGYLAMRDAASDERAENHAAKKAEGIASMLVVPIMVRNKAIGVLSLYTAAPRDFSEEDADFLSALAEQGGMAIQNSRLFERINKNSELFYEMSSNINSSLDIKKIMHIMSASICEAFGMKGVYIRLYNSETGLMEMMSSYGLSETFLNKRPGSPEESEVVAQILKRETVHIFDTAADPRVHDGGEAKREGIKSMLCVPIMSGGEVIGEMRLCSGVEREFSDDVVNLVEALADQGGIAIQNARLFERINKNTELFYEMSSSINSSLDIKKIMHIMSASICEAFGMKGVSIRLYNPETDTMDLMASYGLSEKFLNKGPVSPEKSETVARILEGETIYIRDAATDPRVLYGEEAKREGIKSILCIPIMSREEVIGEMRLCSGVERRFSEDVVKLVEALADQGGIAIQNASMYLMLQEDKKDLEKEVWSHRQWF